jgi:hypothetical protein
MYERYAVVNAVHVRSNGLWLGGDFAGRHRDDFFVREQR